MSSNNLIVQGLTRHQVMIQRLGSGNYRKLEPILESMAKDINARILSNPTSFQLARLNALLKEVNDVLNASGAAFEAELFELLTDFSEYEAEFMQKIVSPLVTVGTQLPATSQMVAALNTKKATLISGKKIQKMTIKQMVKQFTDAKQKDVDRVIRAGFIAGDTSQQIAKSVQSITGIAVPRQAATLVRTATNHAGSIARAQFAKANSDVIGKDEWLSTLDENTTFVCMDRDGDEYPIDKGPYPPAHYNCLTGDTLISTCSDVSSIFKRAYKGIIINITTKSGRSIRVTPNHPILTSSGWVNAGDINSFHKLVCVTAAVDSRDYNKNNVVAKFSDLFSSADVFFNSSGVADRPTTAKDFHGDSTNSKVSVISVDGLRRDNIRKYRLERLINRRLKLGVRVYRSFFGSSRFHSFTKAFLPTFGGAVCSSRKILDFFRRGFSHSSVLLFRPISGFTSFAFDKANDRSCTTTKTQMGMYSSAANTRVIGLKDKILLFFSKNHRLNTISANSIGGKDSFDWLISNAESLPDLFNSKSVNGAELDDVSDFFVSEFDGHVYNLQNENNWYVANGIIAHNCRSLRVPVVKPEYSIYGNDKGMRASKDGPVSAQLTYSGFLRNQSKEFQNDVLGPTRAKLFRSGELTLDKFVDDMGRTLTLEQLRQREGITI